MTCEKHCEAAAYQIVIRNLENNPKKCTWVGLTDEEMLECNMDGDVMIDRETSKRTVEAKLKEKNT